MTPPPLRFAEVWSATFAASRRDIGIYLTIAAAFVLLPTVAAAVLGPPPPLRMSQMSPASALLQLGLAIVGCIAQIAIARLATSGGAVGEAVRTSLVRLPLVVASIVLSSFALVPAIGIFQIALLGHNELAAPAVALLIPGLYVVARLSLVLPLIAGRPVGPVDALRAKLGGHPR